MGTGNGKPQDTMLGCVDYSPTARGGESGDEYSRFAESGRWIAEMTGSRDRELHEQEGNKEPEMCATTT